MWLLLAFLGPVCWAASTHIDKYLVDRYFHDSDTAVLMLFTALVGVALLPFIWWFDPSILKPAPTAILVMISGFGCANGLILTGARVIYAMAHDRVFFPAAGLLNSASVPAFALIIQGVWASILTLSGSYSQLLDYVIFA